MRKHCNNTAITFEQFKKALFEYYENFTIGYKEEHLTDQDIKGLYEDFLQSDEILDEYLKHC